MEKLRTFEELESIMDTIGAKYKENQVVFDIYNKAVKLAIDSAINAVVESIINNSKSSSQAFITEYRTLLDTINDNAEAQADIKKATVLAMEIVQSRIVETRKTNPLFTRGKSI